MTAKSIIFLNKYTKYRTNDFIGADGFQCFSVILTSL